jgi:hypothetical protein
MKFFKASQAEIEKARQLMTQDVNECEVWDDNWRAVKFYLSIRTQWNIAPNGGYIGLNYIAVESTMNIMRVRTKRKCLLKDLQTIEHAMLSILNKPIK